MMGQTVILLFWGNYMLLLANEQLLNSSIDFQSAVFRFFNKLFTVTE